MRFFWYEITAEIRERASSCCLWGRDAEGKRVCARIDAPARVMYALPRTQDKQCLAEAQEEVPSACRGHDFADADVVAMQRNNAFFPQLPRGFVWVVRIRTRSWTATFPRGCAGATFSRIVGQDIGLVERALLKLGLRDGPQWLDYDPDARSAARAEDCRDAPPPALVTLALHDNTFAASDGEVGMTLGDPADVVRRVDPDVVVAHRPGERVRELARGRILCDLLVAAREHMPHRASYELDALGVPAGRVPAETALRAADAIKIVPLALELARQFGFTVNGCLNRGRSKRVEAALLHAFHELNFVLPEAGGDAPDDAPCADRTRRKRHPEYEGGLVLEPEPGLHRTVALLDFRSLYPSLIQQHNICFTTVAPSSADAGEVEPPGADAPIGVLPHVLRRYVRARRAVKEQMRAETDPARLAQLDMRQLALKIAANATYGCLGFARSRFASRATAALVTRLGRENLESAAAFVRTELGYAVACGDTDSLMAVTRAQTADDASRIGAEIAAKINALQPPGSEIEIELADVYDPLLVVAKKKYAARSALSAARVVRGLEIVRRDWAVVARDAASRVLDAALSPGAPEAVVARACEILAEVARRLDAGEVPAGELAITKELSRPLDAYPRDAAGAGLNHVVAARALAAVTGARMGAGDSVTYAMGASGAAVPIGLAVAGGSAGFVPDACYYKLKQILPTVARLLRPIDAGCEPKLAAALGLQKRGGDERCATRLISTDFMFWS